MSCKEKSSPAPYIGIICIGNELTRGQRVDTNSKWLASELEKLGFVVTRISAVRDEVDEIVAELEFVSKFTNYVVTTGGIGPTSDDLTRDALAKFAGVELLFDSPAMERIEERFKKRGRELNEASKRQAYFPKGAEVLPNTVGTADAFITKTKDLSIVTLPGVPREMKTFFSEDVSKWLEGNCNFLRKENGVYARCFGLTESFIASAIDRANLPKELEVTYRASFPEILLGFVSDSLSLNQLEEIRDKIVSELGEEFVFTFDRGQRLKQKLADILSKEQVSVSAAESCSGGKVADSLVSNIGSSAYFDGSLVTYSNQGKSEVLGVSEETLSKFGAVSKEVAEEMAVGARDRLKSDISVSITGVAGPGGGTKDKPVGTVWIALADKEGALAQKFFLPLEREMFRELCASIALDLIRRKLLGYSTHLEMK